MSLGCPYRFDTNQAVQPQKMTLDFRENWDCTTCLCSENKGADQLRSNCAADLCLCFLICKKPFSHDAAHMYSYT